MPRFTLYCGDSAKETDTAERIRSAGAEILAQRPGLFLIEASESTAKTLRGQLANWSVTAENRATQKPPRPKTK